MRPKSLILLAMALGCGLVASVAISQVVMDQKGKKQEVQMVDVLVATKDIDAAGKLNAQNVTLEKWPKDRVPKGAVQTLKDIEGKFANQSVFQGEPIVQKKLINSVDSISGSIPKGFRIFDLAVKAESGGVGYVKPGDHVDIFGYFEKGDRIPETKSMVILENVVVKAIDGNALRDNGEQSTKSAKTIQLLIKEAQYESVVTADHLGKLRVALRAPDEDGLTSNSLETGTTFMSWIRDADRANELASTIGTAAKQVLNPTSSSSSASANQSEMIVISPSGLSRYRWRGDSDIPELVKGDSSTDLAANAINALGSQPLGNVIWNPKTSQWSTSGFSPSYPAADGAPSPVDEPAGPGESGKR